MNMIYVMSDLHGQYEKYLKMLEMISFSDDDTLYVLGDIVDRGDHPIKILQDMSMRSNVFPIMGNHEQMAITMLRKLCVEITADNYASHLTAEDIRHLSIWFINGGQSTLDEFRALSHAQREVMFDYFDEFTYYEEIYLNGYCFVLVHGGLPNFSPEKPLESYDVHQMLWTKTDYSKRYYHDKYLITGHVPTASIDDAYDGKIYARHGHIAIDCGAGYGNPLGCIRLDDFKTFYVE